ncbi:hypothetical protein B296_00018791 [Ensete ventricosum]|uniref:Uncharacterized protein n=1 Tax=Ensete ventricosum TaxID=4639 RepID=A0A427A0X4_ENSVE|nr:hypothetical protein B296_00018791 [Ensete ventricosum]
MEAAASLRSPKFLCKPPDFDSRYCVLAHRKTNFLSFDPRTPLSTPCLKLESPIGQFLYQILVGNSHLLPDAVDQQLEQLQTDREAEDSKGGEPSPPGTDTTLYRRIAEVKEIERRRALEDILYALVVQKFLEAGVSLVHALPPSDDPFGRVDLQSLQVDKLERLHSFDAYAMIESQLELIMTQNFSNPEYIPPISKLRVGNIYAACVKYGYFLKRVDQRFQLEKSLKQATPDESRPSTPKISPPQLSSFSSPRFKKGGCGCRNMSSRLLLYASSFDFDTLNRFGKVRSSEAFTIIKKHTEALLGRPEIVITPKGTKDSSKDELIKISSAGFRRLILEAITFGSFLWDVESYVNVRYHFVG